MELTAKQQFIQYYKQYLQEQSELNITYEQCNPFKVNECKKINQICTDEGKCVNVKQYPLFNLPCYSSNGKDIMCGSLKCFNGKCRNCFDGERYGQYYCQDGILKNISTGYVSTVYFWVIFAMFLIYGAIFLTVLVLCVKKFVKLRNKPQNAVDMNQADQKTD